MTQHNKYINNNKQTINNKSNKITQNTGTEHNNKYTDRYEDLK